MKLTRPPKEKRLVTRAIVGVLLVAAAVYLVYSFLQWNNNYAEETAKPIEKSLVKAGAKKIYSNGDAGRGPDNRTPWYSASYRIATNKADALNLMQAVANENGYKLTHATPSNKGPLEYIVGDEYLDNWYFDQSSKAANFPSMPNEPVQLTMAVNYEGNTTEGADSQHSVIRLDVRLPSFK